MNLNISVEQVILLFFACAFLVFLILNDAPEEKDNEDDLEHMGFV